MPTIKEVRAKYPDYNDLSDTQLADALHQKYYSDMDKGAFYSKIGITATEDKTDRGVIGEAAAGLKAGVKQIEGMGYGLSALGGNIVGSEKLEKWGREKYLQNEAETPKPSVGSYKDIKDAGDVGQYLTYGVTSNLPNMLISLATGGLGGAAGYGTMKVAGKAAVDTAVKSAVKRGAIAGAASSSIGMEAGSITGSQMQQKEGKGEIKPVSAIGGAIPAGLLDVVPEWYLAKRLGWVGKDAVKFTGGKVTRMGKVAGQQFAMEAPTEAMQSVIERSSVPGQSVTNSEAWDEYINSFILGGATGGIVGGAGASFTKGSSSSVGPRRKSRDIGAVVSSGDFVKLDDTELASVVNTAQELAAKRPQDKKLALSLAELQKEAAGRISKATIPEVAEPPIEAAPEPVSGPVVAPRFDDLIKSSASRYGLDPALVAAVIKQESGFNPNARSKAGASGLMQLMPGTARDLGVTDTTDPAQNVDAGAKYLRQMLDRYKGDEKKALAAYNWGMGNVDKFGLFHLPEETRNYISKVLGNKGMFQSGATTFPLKGADLKEQAVRGKLNILEILEMKEELDETDEDAKNQAALEAIASLKPTAAKYADQAQEELTRRMEEIQAYTPQEDVGEYFQAQNEPLSVEAPVIPAAPVAPTATITKPQEGGPANVQQQAQKTETLLKPITIEEGKTYTAKVGKMTYTGLSPKNAAAWQSKGFPVTAEEGVLVTKQSSLPKEESTLPAPLTEAKSGESLSRGEGETSPKQPWEMTKREYVDSRSKNPHVNTELHNRASEQAHAANIKVALKEGLPVPESVLADYPDLKPKAMPPVVKEPPPVAQEAATKPIARRMDGSVRKKRIPKQAPEGFGSLPQISQDKFNEAFESKDTKKLQEYLDPQNKNFRVEFEKRTGKKLPSGVRAKDAHINLWASEQTKVIPSSPEIVEPGANIEAAPDKPVDKGATKDDIVSRVDNAINDRERSNIFIEEGTKAVPGIRLSDAEDAGRIAYLVAKGDATPASFEGWKLRAMRENRVNSEEGKKHYEQAQKEAAEFQKKIEDDRKKAAEERESNKAEEEKKTAEALQEDSEEEKTADQGRKTLKANPPKPFEIPKGQVTNTETELEQAEDVLGRELTGGERYVIERRDHPKLQVKISFGTEDGQGADFLDMVRNSTAFTKGIRDAASEAMIDNVGVIRTEPDKVNPIKEVTKKEQIYSTIADFVSPDVTRHNLRGFYVDNGSIVATNGHIMIVVPDARAAEGLEDGKIYEVKKGGALAILDEQFPDYKRVFPDPKYLSEVGVIPKAQAEYLVAMIEASRKRNRIPDSMTSRFQFKEGDSFDGDYIFTVLKDLLRLGSDTITLQKKPGVVNTPLLLTGTRAGVEVATALTMPLNSKDIDQKTVVTLSDADLTGAKPPRTEPEAQRSGGGEKYSAGESTPPTWNIDDIRKIFKGQEVTPLADGAIAVKTRGGQNLVIKSVDSITPDSANLSIGYGKDKLAEGEVIAGSYKDGEIKLVKDAAGTFTISHESVHFLEDAGILNSVDVAALKGHIKRLVREGKVEPRNKADIGGPEDRADFIARALTGEQKTSGAIRRIIDRIQEFIDRIVNAFGIRTAAGVIRDVSSGDIFDRGVRHDTQTGKMFERYSKETPPTQETSISKRFREGFARAAGVDPSLFEQGAEIAHMFMKEQNDASRAILNAQGGYEQAIQMLTGDIDLPEGLYYANLAEHTAIKAMVRGDYETFRAIMDTYGARQAEKGQEIAAGYVEGSPLNAVREIEAALKLKKEKTGAKGISQEEFDAIRAKLAEAEQKYQEWGEKQYKAGRDAVLKDILSKEEKKEKRAERHAAVKKTTIFLQDEAMKRLEAMKKRHGVQLNAGVDPQDIADMTYYGGYLLEKGIRTAAEWSLKMTEDVGDWTTPFLKETFAKAQKQYGEAMIQKANDKLKTAYEAGPAIDRNQIGKVAYDLAKGFVAGGTNDRATLIAQVGNVLRQFEPTMTDEQVMDAISGYGIYSPPTRDEIVRTLTDLRGQILEARKLIEIEKGNVPGLTGQGRVPKSDEHRILTQKVQEGLKKFGLKIQDKDAHMKTALEKVKKRLENQIADLDAQINKIPPEKNIKQRAGIQYDAEATALQARRDSLKEEFDRIFGKPKMTDEQRARMVETALLKQIKEYDRMIRTGDVSEMKRVSPLHTPRIDELRAERDKLREEVMLIRKPANVLKIYKSRLKNEAKKLEAQLESLDFSKKERAPVKMDDEGTKLKAERDRLKGEVSALSQASGQVTPEQMQELAVLSKTMWDAKDKVDDTEYNGEFGAAKRAFDKYVAQLKGEESTLGKNIKDRISEFKKTWNEEDRMKAVGDMMRDTVSTLQDASVSSAGSMDNSFSGRQGMPALLSGNPKQWAKVFGQSFVNLWKELKGIDIMDAVMADIYSRPNYRNGKYRKAGIIASHEEQFPTEVLGKLPYLGRFFRASSHAYNAAAVTMRANFFDMFDQELAGIGVDTNNEKVVDDLGKLAGTMTSRAFDGKEPKQVAFKRMMRVLLWAGRMLEAEWNAISAHSAGFGLSTWQGRKIALKNTAKIYASILSIAGIATAVISLGGGDDDDQVAWNPLNPNFLQIPVNGQMIDPTGKLAPLFSFIARFVSGQEIDPLTGQMREYQGPFKSRFNVLVNYIANRTKPFVRPFIDYSKGRDFKGRKPTVLREIYGSYTPISIQNAIEAAKGAEEKWVGVVADFVGFGSKDAGLLPRYWNEDSSIEMKQLKKHLETSPKYKDNPDAFEEANKKFNDLVSERFKRMKQEPGYSRMTEDQKADRLAKIRKFAKADIFRRYSFRKHKETAEERDD